jgi:hypothetical protein
VNTAGPRGIRPLDDEEAAFDRYLENLNDRLPSRGRSVLHKPRIPQGSPGPD